MPKAMPCSYSRWQNKMDSFSFFYKIKLFPLRLITALNVWPILFVTLENLKLIEPTLKETIFEKYIHQKIKSTNFPKKNFNLHVSNRRYRTMYCVPFCPISDLNSMITNRPFQMKWRICLRLHWGQEQWLVLALECAVATDVEAGLAEILAQTFYSSSCKPCSYWHGKELVSVPWILARNSRTLTLVVSLWALRPQRNSNCVGSL